MSDDTKKRQNQEQQFSESSEHYLRDYSPIIPRRVQNNNPHTDDGTKETIRNRNSNIEES